MSRRLVSLLIFLGLAATSVLHAQRVRWDPSRGTLAVGQPGELQLIFENCTPEANIPIPKIDGLTLQEAAPRGTSTSIINNNGSLTNFTRSDSVTVTYAALLSRKQRVTIPSFEVNTDKGKVRTTAVTYEAADATVGANGIALETVATAALIPTPASVWAGEVFNLQYTIEVSHSYTPDFGRGQFAWNAEPLVAEEWSRPEPFNRAGADARDGLNYRTRAIVRTPGNLRLNPTQQVINLAVGVTGFGFFQQRQYQQFSIPSTITTLEVKPLPAPPAGFTGAVGALKLNSKVVPATAAVGEPITWTLELSGVANWPDVNGLPARDVSRDFQVVSPQAKRTPVEGKLFEGSLAEDVVLVPTKAGTYTLGPLTFAYFDPKLGSYQTITTAPVTVTITAAAAPIVMLPPPGATTSSDEPKAKASAPQAAPAPAALPRDPLPVGENAWRPLTTGQLTAFLIVPFAIPLLVWLGLALKRARVTDPLLTRRAAHARLVALIEQIRAAGVQPAALRQPLLQWQYDTRLLLGLEYAAPSPAHLGASSPELKTLWSEADRTLYGENSPLPADWTTRASTVLNAAPVPRFSPMRLFLAHNLVPVFVALLLSSLLTPVLNAAESPATPAAKPVLPADAPAAYRRGDFLTAEKGWRAALAANPTDPIARHNLSLALAQQDRWDEASAHAATAFVQSPHSGPIRAQFALSAGKSGHVPASLVSFLTPGPVESLARFASPAVWQYTLCAAAALAAVALALLLHFAYAGRTIATPLVMLGLTGVLALAALVGWKRYGEASNLRAVIVWRASVLRSIPSEADTAQKTTPLAAGSLALVDKTFLNDRWQRLVFAEGQTGWVRSDELVPLWK